MTHCDCRWFDDHHLIRVMAMMWCHACFSIMYQKATMNSFCCRNTMSCQWAYCHFLISRTFGKHFSSIAIILCTMYDVWDTYKQIIFVSANTFSIQGPQLTSSYLIIFPFSLKFCRDLWLHNIPFVKPLIAHNCRQNNS